MGLLAAAASPLAFINKSRAATGSWSHVVGVADGSPMRLYVNGDAVSSYSPTIKNVMDFGATGGGVIDDSAAFRAAFALGGAVYAPAGTYLVESSVASDLPVHLFGDGVTTVIRAGANAFKLFDLRGRFSYVENLRIDGLKSGVGGLPLIGVFPTAPDCTVANVVFSAASLGVGVNVGVAVPKTGLRAIIRDCIFERLISSGGSGVAVILQSVQDCRIENNYIDSSQFTNADGAPGAAIALGTLENGPGVNNNTIRGNRIVDHPQAGMGIASTTYVEFAGNLGPCDGNDISDNIILRCGSARGGPAGSGIAMVSNSNHNRIVGNRIAFCRGHGVSIEGAVQGNGSPGTAKFNQFPDANLVADNDLSNNAERGIFLTNTLNTVRRDNVSYLNGLPDS